MRVIDCMQRTPEWVAARLGRLTGSCVSDAFATRKDKAEAAGRRNLRVQLVLERITGQSQESGFQSDDMRRGIELEPDALLAYEAMTGAIISPVGFVAHDDLMAGCSPDGFVSDGLVEIKCPKAATHLDYVRDGLPREYFLQIVHSLWLTGAAWGDFVSFHPTFPERLRLKVTRVYASETERKAHEILVRAFLSEVDKEEASVRALMSEVAVA